MNEFDKYKRLAERIKPLYPKGTRILLEDMQDTYSPVPSGTKGTVEFVDDQAQIHMKWDNGRTLALIPNVDSFRRLSDEEIQKERLVAAERADFSKYIVCIDGDDRHFTAYNTNEHWNGWECPLFTKSVGEKICQFLNTENCKISYNKDNDCFVATFPFEELTSEYEGKDYNIGGKLVRLYGIGAYEWTWSKSNLNEDLEDDESNAICTEETVDELLDEDAPIQNM